MKTVNLTPLGHFLRLLNDAANSGPFMRRHGAQLSTKYAASRSCYTPHNGKRECARRMRQMAKAAERAA